LIVIYFFKEIKINKRQIKKTKIMSVEFNKTKIILDRQSDLILSSPSITTPTGIVAADITTISGNTVQQNLDTIDVSMNFTDSQVNLIAFDQLAPEGEGNVPMPAKMDSMDL
jgi:hypothetical protein